MNILIAEDEKDIRELIKLQLSREGYQVYDAPNGLLALQAFRKNAIDLAIFDVMMPGLDGFNLLRRIRETSQIPVILLTARGDDMDKVLGLGLGADDYMVKPFSALELVARVQAQLRRAYNYSNKTANQDSRVTMGDIALDHDGCCVYKADQLLALNAKEYKLLKFFMQNLGKVYTKKQLYEAVWEDEYYEDDANTIMVHISHLRYEIEDNPKEPKYLKTIRGIGYMFRKF